MIQVDVALDAAGLLSSCRVSGHAGAGKRGDDVVCAAVSVLSRALVRALAGKRGVTFRGDMPEQGNFWVEVEYTSEGRDFLAGAGSFFIEGILSVSAEFPKHCKVTIDGCFKSPDIEAAT
ncbi:MAG: ribosomal-processing cysteine protease Prp [Treponema sp.]|nr:ribosomal-processing cysteine protease Prp [Treponema sp.]